MQAILSDILDHSIKTSNISVVNYDNGSVYFIPYDGVSFDKILDAFSYIQVDPNFDDDVDTLNFTITCQYSHVGPDNRLNAKYELRLGETLLATEYAPVIGKAAPGQQNSLLLSAQKCARKIITQENTALKRSMLKTMRNGSEYES